MQIIHLFLDTLAHSLIALFRPLSQSLVRAAQLFELFFDFRRGLLTRLLPVGLFVCCELDVRMLHLSQFQVDRADLFGLAVLGQPESRQILRYLRRQRHQPRTMMLPTSSATMEVLLAFLALFVVKRFEWTRFEVWLPLLLIIAIMATLVEAEISSCLLVVFTGLWSLLSFPMSLFKGLEVKVALIIFISKWVLLLSATWCRTASVLFFSSGVASLAVFLFVFILFWSEVATGSWYLTAEMLAAFDTIDLVLDEEVLRTPRCRPNQNTLHHRSTWLINLI